MVAHAENGPLNQNKKNSMLENPAKQQATTWTGTTNTAPATITVSSNAGWVCPKCSRSVAPNNDHCPSCDEHVSVVVPNACGGYFAADECDND